MFVDSQCDFRRSLTDAARPDTQLVATMLIVDPVCMMTCYPQLLANFVYKSPPLAGRPLLEKITFGARFFAARDLVISQVFCRR